MCLFTHFAAGALAGGLTGNIWFGAVAGAASHAVLDAIPHYDHPDWRVELAAGVFSLILLILMPFATWAAVVGGIFGMVPDLENLFQKLGKMRRDQFIYPSHTGLIPHGRRLGPRSLIWQLGIFVFCFALLGILSPGVALAAQVTDVQPVMGDPVVRLLSSDAYMTRIKVECPAVVFPAQWDNIILEKISWATPDFMIQDDDGNVSAHPPRLELNIAVPTRRNVSVNVVGVSWWKEPDTAVSQTELASFSTPAVFRQVPLTGCLVPLGINGGVLRSVIIEVQHQPAGKYSQQLQLANDSDSSDKRSENLDKAPVQLLNPALFERLSSGGRTLLTMNNSRKARGEFNHFDLTSNWVRLSIDENGLHSLTGQELSSMGVNTSNVDPDKIRIFRGGNLALDKNPEIAESAQAERVGLQEVAIQVLDGNDGEWNLDDEIRFYAFGSDFWKDRFDPTANHLEFYNHPYQNGGIYWMTWENTTTSSPIAGDPLRVSENNTPANGGAELSMAKLRMHKERQTLEGFGMSEDNWVWDSSIYNTKTLSFELFSPVADSSATYVVDYRGYSVGSSSDSYVFMSRAWINNDTAHARDATVVSIAQQDSLRIRLVGSSLEMREGSNILSFQNSEPEKRFAQIFDSFDIFYWADLNLAGFGGQMEFAQWKEQVAFDGQQVNMKITVPTGDEIVLWDVSSVGNSSVLHGDLSGSNLTCGLTLDTAVDRHFLVTSASRLFRVASGKVVAPLALRNEPIDSDYVVVYAAPYAGAARSLRDFRSSFLPGISAPKATMVLVDDIYNNFSGGQKDIRAIRNYLKMVYEDGAGRLRYVCLIGNATLDHRNYKDQDPNSDLMDLMPADHRTYFPLNVGRSQVNSPYGSDDTVVSFDAPGSVYDTDFPDVAIGRLPAINSVEANGMVDRIIQYSSSVEPGTWSNKFLMVADDCVTPKFSDWPDPHSSERRHTNQAEDLSNDFLPPSLDLNKVYGVAYDFPPGSTVKPQSRQDINKALSEGTTVFHYVGHGAENNLADEQMFQSQDIANLTNGMKRFAFIAFSCDVGVYDSPTRRSMAELFIVAPNGGAIASICASQVSYTFSNDLLSEGFYEALYPGRNVSVTQTLSEALLDSKATMTGSFSRHNSQRYNLLSDPALSLPNPEDDLAFAATSIDTLRAGARQVVVLDEAAGLMLGAGDQYSLQVEESAFDYPYIYKYIYPDGVKTPEWHSFVNKGAMIFDGHGTMTSSELRVPFKVPVQLRYGERARLRLLLEGLDGQHAAVLAVSAVRQATGPSDDLIGPQINLAFENNSYRVKVGSQLTATLQDTSSIAILGTSPGNSLLLEFDDSGFMTDVTSSFAFNADSYTNGRISFPLPGDLPLGNHQAALHASDVLGNVGNDTISFVIVPDNIVGMESVTLFPNPTPGPCRLIFELSDPMQVNWEIYTLSGRRIKSMEETFSAGPQIIPWDGRDDQGDEIANGTYLYVLRGTVTGGGDRDITETGKLVIMR